jgi:hypothetical protein
MTFPTPHIGHSRHGLFFTRWIVNHMLNHLKRTMTYPGFEPGTFGLALHHLGRLNQSALPCCFVHFYHTTFTAEKNLEKKTVLNFAQRMSSPKNKSKWTNTYIPNSRNRINDKTKTVTDINLISIKEWWI